MTCHGERYINYVRVLVRLVIFVGPIFRGLESSDNFAGSYFRGVPTLIT